MDAVGRAKGPGGEEGRSSAVVLAAWERFLVLLLCDCHLKGHIRFV